MQLKISRASSRSPYKDKPCQRAILAEVDKHGYHNWEVNINTLEELLELQKEVGDMILFQHDNSITIYDDYVE